MFHLDRLFDAKDLHSDNKTDSVNNKLSNSLMNFENFMLDLSIDEIFLEKELKIQLYAYQEEIKFLEKINGERDV